MKNIILPALAVTAAFFSLTATAQQNRTFAVTGEAKGSFNWNTVREINAETGEVIKTYYDRSTHKNFEIVNTDNVKLSMDAALRGTQKLMPMADGVAASAYDAKHNRLYFTPMRGTDLRYFDLNSAEGKLVYNQSVPLFGGNKFDEANVITRMAFAADGFGYAITNDGNHLVRFTTDQKPTITDLGQLIDGKDNGSISIHNLCSSWGGDMVGDAYGNLYLISMRNNVFKINTQTRNADFIGHVKGLPAEFTTNGMAVDGNGEILLSSATLSDSYYKLNISTLQASALKTASGDKVYNASDLASSNLLYQNNKSITVLNPVQEVLGNKAVSVFPNPVASKVFSVQFQKVPAGKYELLLTDASGRSVLARSMVINASGQLEKINMPRTASAGMYLLKLTGGDKSVVYSNKLMVK